MACPMSSRWCSNSYVRYRSTDSNLAPYAGMERRGASRTTNVSRLQPKASAPLSATTVPDQAGQKTGTDDWESF